MVEDLPVVIIGAGPVGLAAAAHLRKYDQDYVVLESGPAVAHSMREWGHVRLFSPWRYLVDPASAELLESVGWVSPDPAGHPTGAAMVQNYLEPLATALGPNIHLSHRVVAITRFGHDRMKDGERARAPFVVVTDTPQGRRQFSARAVIDASGTWATPNPIGSGGIAVAGEREASANISYGLPDITGRPERFAGKRVLVLGSGHSAINSVLALTKLEGTRIAWGVRRPNASGLWGGGDADELPARGSLGSRAREAVESGRVHLLHSLSVGRIVRNATGLDVLDVHNQPRCNVDEIIAATGSRPDLSITRELRLEFDPATEAAKALGPLIDPNHHSCGSVSPHGVVELTHPAEPGFYTVGMKSYGRAPTFLVLTGYEQVRSVAAELAGDTEAARRVELVLPETGVCGPSSDANASACC